MTPTSNTERERSKISSLPIASPCVHSRVNGLLIANDFYYIKRPQLSALFRYPRQLNNSGLVYNMKEMNLKNQILPNAFLNPHFLLIQIDDHRDDQGHIHLRRNFYSMCIPIGVELPIDLRNHLVVLLVCDFCLAHLQCFLLAVLGVAEVADSFKAAGVELVVDFEDLDAIWRLGDVGSRKGVGLFTQDK